MTIFDSLRRAFNQRSAEEQFQAFRSLMSKFWQQHMPDPHYDSTLDGPWISESRLERCGRRIRDTIVHTPKEQITQDFLDKVVEFLPIVDDYPYKFIGTEICFDLLGRIAEYDQKYDLGLDFNRTALSVYKRYCQGGSFVKDQSLGVLYAITRKDPSLGADKALNALIDIVEQPPDDAEILKFYGASIDKDQSFAFMGIAQYFKAHEDTLVYSQTVARACSVLEALKEGFGRSPKRNARLSEAWRAMRIARKNLPNTGNGLAYTGHQAQAPNIPPVPG